MYNLDVANLDNFYVGEQGWLVHNAGVMDCLGNAAKALGWGAGNSDTLRANLKAAGLVPPGAPNAAHHIVPHSDLRALPSIEVMVKYGIHSDDAVNGVFLRYVDNIGEGGCVHKMVLIVNKGF